MVPAYPSNNMFFSIFWMIPTSIIADYITYLYHFICMDTFVHRTHFYAANDTYRIPKCIGTEWTLDSLPTATSELKALVPDSY